MESSSEGLRDSRKAAGRDRGRGLQRSGSVQRMLRCRGGVSRQPSDARAPHGRAIKQARALAEPLEVIEQFTRESAGAREGNIFERAVVKAAQHAAVALRKTL